MCSWVYLDSLLHIDPRKKLHGVSWCVAIAEHHRRWSKWYLLEANIWLPISLTLKLPIFYRFRDDLLIENLPFTYPSLVEVLTVEVPVGPRVWKMVLKTCVPGLYQSEKTASHHDYLSWHVASLWRTDRWTDRRRNLCLSRDENWMTGAMKKILTCSSVLMYDIA